MVARQLEHHEVVNQQKKFPIAIVCDNLANAENVGMAFRLVEAMGVSQIYLCGSTPCPPDKKIARVARSTVDYVDFFYFRDTLECINKLELDGYTLYCLEITKISQAVRDVSFSQDKKIALVVGNENKGIDMDALRKVERHVHIEMYGVNSSMNVIQSLSMALYEIVNQLTSSSSFSLKGG